jgi:DNA helicase-2/ATP-dependent DNA helicase PcrA
MWDEPEPRDSQFNRFARREVTKAARAAEYWSSDFDEYALPDSAKSLAGGSSSGFRTAREGYKGSKSNDHQTHNRLGKPYPTKPGAQRPAPPPVIKLAPTNLRLAEPIPFTFDAPRNVKPKADIGGFLESSNSSLAIMRSLGLPEDDELPLLSVSGGSSPVAPGRASVQLARGTKRLGMGRPTAWGTKRPRQE